MKRELKKLVFFLALAFLFAATAAHAENGMSAPINTDRSAKLDLGFNVSGAMSSDDELDDTVFLGGNLSWGLNRWLAIGVEVGWQDRSLHDDDLTAVPIFADLYLRMPTDSVFVPYLVGGVGGIVWSFDGDGVEDIDDDFTFGAKGGGGLDIFLNDHWILNLEVAYVYTDNDVSLSSGTRADTDYWLAGGGLKYVF